jgi:hypothetical protein
MDVNECGKLIERYWEGDTSCDEEQAMVHFFGEHSELPPELERWRGWFSGLHAATSLPDESFDRRVLAAIDARPARRLVMKRSLVYRIAVAASIVLIAAIGVRQLVPSAHPIHEMSEAEARETVRSLLLLSSSTINRAEDVVHSQLNTTKVLNEIANTQPHE